MQRLFVLTALLFAIPAYADTLLVNNGLAPPNPENVIDYASPVLDRHVYVRNVGCGTIEDPDSDCISPGEATEVAVVDGAEIFGVHVHDSSTVVMNGGSLMAGLSGHDKSNTTISGGDVGSLYAWGDASIRMDGGVVEHVTRMGDHSTLTVSQGVISRLEAYGSSVVVIEHPDMPGWHSASDNASVTIGNGIVGGRFTANDNSSVTFDGTYIAESLISYGSSSVTFLDGVVVEALVIENSGTVTIAGGRIVGEVDCSGDSVSSTILMTGGTIEEHLYVGGSSTATITGGSIEACLVASHISSVTIVSGQLFCLVGNSSATITVSGGVIEQSLVANDSSLIRVVGTGFTVDGIPVPYGDLTATEGTLTGTLASGDPINVIFYQGRKYTSGTITLSAPTECSDFVDNDGDSLVDYPDDPGCFNSLWFTESPQCQDGVNNDTGQDSLIDWDGGDPQCRGPWDDNERCGLGAELALLLAPLMWMWRRRRSYKLGASMLRTSSHCDSSEA